MKYVLSRKSAIEILCEYNSAGSSVVNMMDNTELSNELIERDLVWHDQFAGVYSTDEEKELLLNVAEL